MEITPCSFIPPHNPVAPQSEYEEEFEAALNQKDLPKKKLNSPLKSQRPKKKSSNILLTASPEFHLESANEKDELV